VEFGGTCTLSGSWMESRSPHYADPKGKRQARALARSGLFDSSAQIVSHC
jgi:hypothetical protein